jgi:hypothetical protein
LTGGRNAGSPDINQGKKKRGDSCGEQNHPPRQFLFAVAASLAAFSLRLMKFREASRRRARKPQSARRVPPYCGGRAQRTFQDLGGFL